MLQNSKSSFPVVPVATGVGIVILLGGALVWFTVNRSSQLRRKPGSVPSSALPVASVVAVIDRNDVNVDRISQNVDRQACNRTAPMTARAEVVSPKFLEYKHQVNPM